MTSILAVDIGNTSTTIGVVTGTRVGRVRRLERKDTTPDSIRKTLKVMARNRLDGVCMASVVPALNASWNRAVKSILRIEPLWVNHRVKLGMPVTYAKPSTIGADRLANAVGGRERYGAPLIIADFGTAVTFDVISAEDGYIGGIIAPGLPLMFDYLAEKTALLAHLTLRKTQHRVGKSTREAMQLGARWGYRGMVKEILQELLLRPDMKNASICATGGYASWVLKGMKPEVRIDPGLTLFGLGCIYRLNHS